MRVLLHTGGGGAGTTTVAAATAVHAARSGSRALVVSTTADRSLAQVLGHAVSREPAEVEPGLFAQHVGAGALQLGDVRSSALTRAASELGLPSWSVCALPGVPGLLTLSALVDQAQNADWDVVVVDCGPVEQALRLLTLPDVLGRGAGQLLSAQRRPELAAALRELSSELAVAATVLHAPSTSARLVLNPTRLAVAESLRGLTALALHGFVVDAVIAGKVVPAGAGDPWLAARAAAQAEALAELTSVSPVPVQHVEHLAVEPLGTDLLAGLALGRLGVTTDGPRAQPLDVERAGSGFELVIDLPLVTATDVDLARAGDDLVLTVGSHRRVVALPAALRRCRTGGARMREGRLRVRFEPDPALWPVR